MAVTITTDDISAAYPDLSTQIPASIQAGFIAKVAQADQCLDANYPDADLQYAIKMAGIGYLMQTTAGDQNIASERSANGSSVSYKDNMGVGSTAAGAQLKALDTSGCLLFILGSNDAPMGFWSSNGSY